jgi:hypothetical protein
LLRGKKIFKEIKIGEWNWKAETIRRIQKPDLEDRSMKISL